MVPKHSMSYGHQSRTFAKPVKKILYFEVAVRPDRILKWIESIEIVSERRVMVGSWASKKNVIFSTVALLCILSLSMMADQGNALVSW